VKRAGRDSAIIEFNNVTAGPGYNQATIDPVKVAASKNVIIYSMQEGCIIRMRFYNNIAVVDYITMKGAVLLV
jgi:hypothetical protein